MSETALAPTSSTPSTTANLAADLKPPGEASAKVKVHILRPLHLPPIPHPPFCQIASQSGM
ncbi:MAG: hypothetical protein Q9218_006659 [Villophora microphyllina]